MTGMLAIWNDIAPEGHAHFERWFTREHLQERLDVPGFRLGRRPPPSKRAPTRLR